MKKRTAREAQKALQAKNRGGILISEMDPGEHAAVHGSDASPNKGGSPRHASISVEVVEGGGAQSGAPEKASPPRSPTSPPDGPSRQGSMKKRASMQHTPDERAAIMAAESVWKSGPAKKEAVPKTKAEIEAEAKAKRDHKLRGTVHHLQIFNTTTNRVKRPDLVLLSAIFVGWRYLVTVRKQEGEKARLDRERRKEERKKEEEEQTKAAGAIQRRLRGRNARKNAKTLRMKRESTADLAIAEELRKKFADLDADGDGTLEPHEIKAAAAALGMEPSKLESCTAHDLKDDRERDAKDAKEGGEGLNDRRSRGVEQEGLTDHERGGGGEGGAATAACGNAHTSEVPLQEGYREDLGSARCDQGGCGDEEGARRCHP